MVIDPKGRMALYRSDSLLPVVAGDFDKLRVFTLDSNNRFVPRRYVAVPTAEGFELHTLRPARREAHAPGRTLRPEELRDLPFFDDIYIARRTVAPITASRF